MLRVEDANGFLEVSWDEEWLCTVYKPLFVKGLAALKDAPSRESFEADFAVLEKKLAKQELLRLLARKGHLAEELRRKLTAKGFSHKAIEEILLWGQAAGIVNDTEELERILQREQRRGRGPRAILFKLKQKKVSPAELKKLAGALKKEEPQTLEELLRRRYGKLLQNNPKDPRVRKKVIGALQRRGFSLEAIFLALRVDADWH